MRAEREVISSLDIRPTGLITAFVGLFNAEPFWDVVTNNLHSQSFRNCHVLLVDNGSSDSTWELLKQIELSRYAKVTLVKNPRNLGGIGSLMANLDLVTSPWVATIHQDDYYYPNHLEVLSTLAQESRDDVAILSTSMDSWNTAKGRVDPFPRLSWVADGSSNVEFFLANARAHLIPFPASAFRVSALLTHESTWHDTSFVDTELVLKLCANWTFKLSSSTTMAYRENPVSESHVLSSSQKQRGQARALRRVFESKEFEKVAKTVAFKDRDSFFEHLLKSVELRLKGEEDELRSTSSTLTHSLAAAWNYSSAKVNQALTELSRGEQNLFAVEFLKLQSIDSSSSLGNSASGPNLTPPRPMSAGHKVIRLVLTVTMKIAHKFGLLGKLRQDLDVKWKRR